jgi:hypothetical protein
LGGRQRKEQCSGLTRQYTKSKALVESNTLIVLCIHQKGERGGACPQRSDSSIGQERRAQAKPLKSPVHGQPPDANSGR